MTCIRSARKGILISGLLLAVMGFAFLATQPTTFAYDDVAKIAEPTAYPLEHERGESELPWLFAVYIITWAAFFGYVFAMSRRQREMRREIEVMRRVLEERERQAAAIDAE